MDEYLNLTCPLQPIATRGVTFIGLGQKFHVFIHFCVYTGISTWNFQVGITCSNLSWNLPVGLRDMRACAQKLISEKICDAPRSQKGVEAPTNAPRSDQLNHFSQGARWARRGGRGRRRAHAQGRMHPTAQFFAARRDAWCKHSLLLVQKNPKTKSQFGTQSSKVSKVWKTQTDW